MTGAPDVTTSLRHRLIRMLGGEPVPDGRAAAPGPDPSPAEPVEPAAPEEVVGLVVSGGGARSSFQIGALTYLYEQDGFAPQVMTGTSAGSILTAVIAQYSDQAGQREAVADLRRLWLGMRSSSDLFEELPWFTKLREHMPTWRKVMALRHRPGNRTALTTNLASVLQGPIKAVERLTARQAEHHEEATRPAPADVALVTAEHDQTPPEHTPLWSSGNVLDTLATIWEASRTSTDVQTILTGAQTERAAFRPGPLVDRVSDPRLFDPSLLAASGVRFRAAVVALESGELRYVDELGRLRDRVDALLPEEDPVDLIEAIRASCAIPAVFAPVRLNDQHYVDGGARESLPVEIAVSELGVTRCFAVVASPAGLPWDGGYADKDMLEIVMRSGFGIMTDEIQLDEIRRAQTAGAMVIQPELDIHDLLTVEPGLVSIAMDYGYLRARDVYSDASAEVHEHTRNVINLRRLIWTTEDEMFNPARDPALARPPMAELVELKLRLRELLEEHPATLPPGAASWWRTWERHGYPVGEEPNWV
ncbi:patatin-like phospholipase family protein [Occultella gossypii]|uniref:Patatin-like phospholipase family protein n=1 Tax=Occultella gossypii TaxID=2800820 RepID=A0ABS7SBQ6_9MICO|nr:patatin-like phospholipase family protein [Occultella gossypii]MBZ2197775.1 patatin-like phospholipase family protein [Occultella gossypii]